MIGGAVLWTAPAVQALSTSAAHAQTQASPVGPPPPPTDVPECGCLTGGGQIYGGTYRGQTYTTRAAAGGLTTNFGLSPICCDLFPGTELEVNIRQGPGAADESFHFNLNLQLTCINDPAVDPSPPPGTENCADTFTGSIQDASGNTLYFTLVDEGEPGNNDRASLRIVDSGGTEVLNVSGTIDVGNLQAHPDLGPMLVDCDCPEAV